MIIYDIDTGDKFIAVKKMWFLDEGTIVDVTNMSDDGIVSFTFGENNTNNGYMDFDTFIERFKKIENMTSKVTVPTITHDHLSEIMENSGFEIQTVFDKCAVVSCRLPNGFVIVESTSCNNASEYDEEEAIDICIDKIASKVWELESYRLHCEIEEEIEVEVETDIEIEVDEEDEVDCNNCNNCDDYSCPDNPNYRFNN